MSWKNVKEHYRIGHIVCVTEEGICIGSPYIHNLIVVGLDGVLKKRERSTFNADLVRYQSEMEADPDLLKRLVETPDTFGEVAGRVYTYKGGEILEKLCDAYGWPNVTHDGCLMYQNTYSDNKADVVSWAKSNAAGGVKMATQWVKELEKELDKACAWLVENEANLAKLNFDYPELPLSHRE